MNKYYILIECGVTWKKAPYFTVPGHVRWQTARTSNNDGAQQNTAMQLNWDDRLYIIIQFNHPQQNMNKRI